MKEHKRIIRYVAIGIFTTLVTLGLWSILYNFSDVLDLNKEVRFSVSQFIASSMVIPLSFYINRKVTFKDKARRHKSKKYTLINVFGVYLASPAIASVFTYLIQIILPGLFPELLLKFIGLAAGMVMNYSGQRLWIYKAT